MIAFIMRHRSTATWATAICVMAAIGLWNEIGRANDRDQARERAADLACIQEIDARASLKVLSTPGRVARDIPGDELLIKYRTRLVNAAKQVNPDCVIPKELR